MSALRVGIAMSGGVDSTIAAALLLEQGFAVQGFFMELPLPTAENQAYKARQMAAALGIPLRQIDLRHRFQEQVIRYFSQSYLVGKTPNPCIQCNRLLKFGALAEAMLAHGMERIATGHYAQIRTVNQRALLFRGNDPRKDQSYFLAGLSARQLAHSLFPLGNWHKAEVYKKAKALGLHFAGEESQDTCFLETTLAVFLHEQGIVSRDGPLVNREGNYLGRHRGIWNYTVGQRRGLGLPDTDPWYVLALVPETNTVVVGKKTALYQNDCLVEDLRWIHQTPPLPWQGYVQLRSRHQPAWARLEPTDADGLWQLHFAEPQRAIAPGQFAVFYEQDQVLGCATQIVPNIDRGQAAH